MSHKVIITRVGKDVGNPIGSQMRQHIGEELNVEFRTVETVEEVFPLLSDPNYHTDFINIDIESFHSVDGSDVFDVIQTLHTLVKCTVERNKANAKPVKRNTKIGTLISSTTPPHLIKEIMKFPAISFVLPKYDGVFNYEVCKQSLIDQINGVTDISKVITNLIRNKPKKEKSKLDHIDLTPRQHQIVDLICSKGASNKVIARLLGISESTVKLHVSLVFKKYGVKSRTQLAVFTKR